MSGLFTGDEVMLYVVGLDCVGNVRACTICSQEYSEMYVQYYRSLKNGRHDRFKSVRTFTADGMKEHAEKTAEERRISTGWTGK